MKPAPFSKVLRSSGAALALLSLAASTRAADTSTWAKFSDFNYTGKSAVTPKPGEYLNPIIAGFHPDPSICRAGDDYYLVNSSFNYFPGIPIWHSKDLVNWTQIGNVIDRPSQMPMRGGDMSAGTFAPTIRYHDGTFYMINTLVGSSLGNYYVTAKDPKGPWSEPVKLDGVGGIDPDIFFDDDGKCYITSCDEPPQALYNGHRAITLREWDLGQKKLVGDKTILISGGTDISKKPVWCEGPHLYKINGKYYAMCAQGGTSGGHTEVIFKSDSLRGPYVPWDKNPILTQMGLPDDRPNPVTCTGHADLVQTQKGDWYAVFLGCQPYQGGNFNTGRETFLLPVTWTADGWPLILPPKTEVPLTVKKPNLPAAKSPSVPTTGNVTFTENFASPALPPRWIGIRVPAAGAPWWAVANNALFLEPRADQLSNRSNPSYLGIRQLNNDFNCSIVVTAQPKTADCSAGLAAFQNDTHYYAIDVKIAAGKLQEISLVQGGGRGQRGGVFGAPPPPPKVLATEKLPAGVSSVQLEIEGRGPATRFFYRTDNKPSAQLSLGGEQPSSFLGTDTAGGFQGVTLGVFAQQTSPAPGQNQ